MKYYIVKLETGTVGTETHELLSVEDGTTQEEMEDMIHEMALNNAEMYGIYEGDPYQDMMGDDEDDIDNYMSDSYSDDISGYILGEYDPEEHDCLRPGGGSFQLDIDRNQA
jgi:hypothetical protein